MIIGVIIFILLLAGNVFLGYKYFRFKQAIKSYNEIGTGRIGFYVYNPTGNYSAIVFVKELDRYTDGYSKLKIDRIEPKGGGETSIEWATEAFTSLKKTLDVEWLESIDQIKKIRKEKLLKLKKI